MIYTQINRFKYRHTFFGQSGDYLHKYYKIFSNDIRIMNLNMINIDQKMCIDFWSGY